MKRRIAWLVLPVTLFAACGNDDIDPKEACSQMVDAFTNAWVRCERSASTARQTWTTALSSCNPNSVDTAKFEQCKADLASADCAVIKTGGYPKGNCDSVLGQ